MILSTIFCVSSVLSTAASESSPPPRVLVPPIFPTLDSQYLNKTIHPITTSSSSLVTTTSIDPATWNNNVCRGRKLFLAMTHDSSQGTQYLDPLASPFSGPLTQELKDWGWEHQEENYWCEFAEEGYSRAFAALGISDKSFDEGGDNMCYTSFHYDSENVFDPEDPDEPDDTFPEKDRQWYLAPNGRDMRCTGASYTLGVNPQAGVIYFISRESPMEAAKKLWGYTPQSNELPDLRSSSDFAWGFWDFAKQGEGLGDIRKIFSMYITNKETLDVIDKVATMQGVTGVGEWPGVEVDAKMEQGLALIGSPNGRAAGYLLAQHKAQLGEDKFISKITMFRSDQSVRRANLIFWVDNVPNPPPKVQESDGGSLGAAVKGRGLQSCGDNENFTREHVIRG